jgi:hypothetical protein
MGVPIVFHHVANQPHTPSPHFARFPTRTPKLSLYGSIFYLHFRSIMNPPFHPQSVCPSASLPSFSPTTYRNSPMGPPPFINFPRKLCPPWATHITLGHSFLYLYISPQIIRYLLYKLLYFQSFHYPFLSSPLAIFFPPFGQTQPMSPLVGALLIIHSCWHSPYLQSTPTCHLPLPSDFVYLVLPLAQLITGLVIPLTFDLVTRLHPLFISYILQPRAVLSLPTS